MEELIRDTDIKIPFEKYGKMSLNLNKTAFFDIETTGFSARNTDVYLIGCVYPDIDTGFYKTIQWFAENKSDEEAVLKSFFSFIDRYEILIHYNGFGFDIPYLEEKALKYKILFNFKKFKHIDLYREASKIKNIFKTVNLKQKTMESFFGINREDKYPGGELIAVYDLYKKAPDQEKKNILLLHNFDDICGMTYLLEILPYNNLFKGKFDTSSISVESVSRNTDDEYCKKICILEYKLNIPVKKRVSYGNENFYMTAFNDKLKIKVNVYTNELKYYFQNYRDYYYLPDEDRAIHKSVAFYVDKNFRTRAKAANCYSKKTGQFLPQYKEIVSPYFKIDYNDKITYFELTENFMENAALIKKYGLNVLETLIKQ